MNKVIIPAFMTAFTAMFLGCSSTEKANESIKDTSIKSLSTSVTTSITRGVENLNRGVVAVKTDEGVFISWRRLGSEPLETNFSLYRDNILVTNGQITNYIDKEGTLNSKYKVVTNNKTQSKQTPVLTQQYIDIPLHNTPMGEVADINKLAFEKYTPNDCSVGDLDGDGEYEIVMQWDPNSKEVSPYGSNDKTYVDAYKLDGTFLWRIDIGKNLRAWDHNTQLIVADFNSDGKSEVSLITVDGSIAGDGTIIGDPSKDWMSLNELKRNLNGPLYLTVFEGATGKILDSIPYDPQSGDSGKEFGDNWGNRSHRFNTTIAYLDGVHPSIVTARGYYKGKPEFGPGRTVVATYDLINNKLKKKWRFDTSDTGYEKYIGQGNHSIASGDIDGDGYDEIIAGSLALDHDGSVLWCTGYGHGDAHHLGDFDPTHPGLEYMKVYEEKGSLEDKSHPGFKGARNQKYGMTVQDAATGEILQSRDGQKDTGRGMIGNIGYKDSLYVAWAAANTGYIDNKGNALENLKLSYNGRIYWDGGLSDQLQDHFVDSDGVDHITITKWNNDANSNKEIFRTDGPSINGTKGNANLLADIIGDWREEIITYKEVYNEVVKENVLIDGKNYIFKRDIPKYVLRIYTTTIPTKYNFSTLMHDYIYRNGVAAYNVGYNQPAHISFYLSDTVAGYTTQPKPNVKLVLNNFVEEKFNH